MFSQFIYGRFQRANLFNYIKMATYSTVDVKYKIFHHPLSLLLQPIRDQNMMISQSDLRNL